MRFLILYFRSGWAFLLPYFGLYSWYAWTRWPLNPGPSGAGTLPLLHLFWLLHAVHLFLAIAVVGSRWRAVVEAAAKPWSYVPWVALGLLFWLPGVYLEFPADPWEHYGRINRWKDILFAEPGAPWLYKTGSYFLAYSVLGQLPVAAQLVGLDIFLTVVALLLSWQYYRLGEACGLGPRAAMCFTLLQSFVLGNDLFGFHRYYGLSSSAFAQIGAMAAIRMAVEWSKATRPAPPVSPSGARFVCRTAATGFAWVFAAGFSTINHLQGLGLALLGLGAVALWHTAKAGWKFLVPALLAIVCASLAGTLFWPRHDVIDTVYTKSGWLNAWGGFDLLSPESPAARRMLLILGMTGVANLAAALLLLKRNHVVSWLTLAPLCALQLAFVALPLANLLGQSNSTGIVVFHRLFLATPPALALIVAMTVSWPGLEKWRASPAALPAVLILACAGFTLMPPNLPWCNRLWNAWARTPRDLAMTTTLVQFDHQESTRNATAAEKPLLIAPAAIVNVLQAYSPRDSLFITEERLFHSPVARSPAADWKRIRNFLDTHPAWGRPFIVLPAPSPFTLYTPQSQAALLSRHWNPSEVALGFAR